MDEGARKEPRRNAGAFLGPDILVGVPMRTLSDDYRDESVDPPDDHVPDPEPPGLIGRVAEAIRGRMRRTD